MNDNKNVKDCQTVPLFAVYVIWCRITNMHYVGVTRQQVKLRIRQHKKGKQQFIDKEIRRLGWEGNFDWWLVETHVPADQISDCEQKWVGIFDCVFPKGYNKTCGGIKHFKHSKKTRDQMGDSHRGKKRAPFTEEHRANLSKAMTGKKGAPAWNKGIPCPEEVKDKIREKLTGRKRPDQSERMKGENNPNFGKPMPEETKEILRQKALARDISGENNPMYGKHHTDEVRAAQSARMSGENNPNYGKPPANKGVPHTDEEKAKISAAVSGEKNGFFGKHHTEEAKERNRQAHLGKPSWNKGVPCREKTKAILREKALARNARKRAAKATAEENRAAANTAPTNLSTLLDAVIL